METVELLKRVRIFQGLDDEQLERFAAVSTEKSYDPDDLILEQGVEGEALFIIQRGTVKVLVVEGEVESEVAKLVAGEAFGEMSLIEDNVTSARIAAYNGVDCLIINEEEFMDVMESNSEISSEVYRNFTIILSERLRATTEKLATWQPDIDD